MENWNLPAVGEDGVPLPPPDLVSDGYRYNAHARPHHARKASTPDTQNVPRISFEIQGRRKGYFLTEDVSTGALIEKETFTCGHCQHITIVEFSQRLDDIGCFCSACMRPCCKKCAVKMAGDGPCEVWEKQFDRLEAQARSRASMGL